MSGGPGWIRTINLPIQSRALRWLSYGAMIRQPDLHRSRIVTNDERRYLRFDGVVKWSGISVLPRVSRRSEQRGLLSSSCPDTLCPSRGWSHGESHPDLRNAVASSCYWTMAPKWTRAPDSHRVIRFCRFLGGTVH